MIRKGVLPQQSVSPSVYEAVGKLLLSNAVAGSPLKPVVGLNDKVTCSDDDPEYVALLVRSHPLRRDTFKAIKVSLHFSVVASPQPIVSRRVVSLMRPSRK